MAYIGPEPNPGQNREVDDISSGFNGSEVNFTLQVNSQNVSPGSANAIIVSLGGVVQNPGTDYTVAASTLTFTTAPANGLSFFGLVLGQQIDTEGTADASITASKLAPNAVTTAKILDDNVTFEKIQNVSATDRILGRDSSGAGVIEEITPAALRTMINVADGATAGGGKVLQVVSTTKTAVASNSTGSGSLWNYNNSSLRATITASNASNFFKITGQVNIGSNGLAVGIILYDNGSPVTTAGVRGDASGSTRRSVSQDDNGNTEGTMTIPIHIYISCADTSEHKFHYAFWHNGGGTNDINLNRPHSGTDSDQRGRFISNITVEEVAA